MIKDPRHKFFWVEDERLFETYETIRGLRYRFKKDVPGKPDCDNADENGDERRNKMNESQQVKKALDKYFEPSKNVTAQDVLYKQFVEQYGAIVSKFQMYICFATGWGNCTGKAENGSAGYHMKVKQKGEIK